MYKTQKHQKDKTCFVRKKHQHESQPVIFLSLFEEQKGDPSPAFTTGQGLTTRHWATGLGWAVVIFTVIVIVGWAGLSWAELQLRPEAGKTDQA